MSPASSGPGLLILDTCALLDIVRAATRPDQDADVVSSTRKVIAGAARWACGVRTPEVALDEFNNRVDGVFENAQSELRNVAKRASHAHGASVQFGNSDASPIDRAWADALSASCRQLADDMVAKAGKLSITSAMRDRGFARAAAKRAPAVKGSAAIADSVIIECALEAAAGWPAVSVFLSSNIADLCEHGSLHPDLVPEFDNAGLQYARSWSEAVRTLGL